MTVEIVSCLLLNHLNWLRNGNQWREKCDLEETEEGNGPSSYYLNYLIINLRQRSADLVDMLPVHHRELTTTPNSIFNPGMHVFGLMEETEVCREKSDTGSDP